MSPFWNKVYKSCPKKLERKKKIKKGAKGGISYIPWCIASYYIIKLRNTHDAISSTGQWQFRFGFTRTQSLKDTVTKSVDIQATQQLNSTKLKEPGDKRKAESQPEVFAGKSKRDRKYQTSWERDFPWLVHDEEKNTMKCKIWQIADKSSFLFIGNGAFRRTTIQAHAKSKTHFKCFEANSARENPGAAPMRTVPRNMNAQVNEKLQKLFNSAYFIGKFSISLKSEDKQTRENKDSIMTVLCTLSINVFKKPPTKSLSYVL